MEIFIISSFVFVNYLLRYRKLNQVTIRKYKPDQDITSVTRILTNCFYESEYSWSRPLGRQKIETERYFKEIHLPSLPTNPPSLVATIGNNISGVLTLTKFEKSINSSEKQVDPIYKLLQLLDDIFWNEFNKKGYDPKLICYFAFLGVDSTVRRNKIGTKLVRAGIDLAIGEGYKILLAYCSSPKSFTIFKKEGFTLWGSVEYKTLKFEEKYPYHSIPDSVTVMVKVV